MTNQTQDENKPTVVVASTRMPEALLGDIVAACEKANVRRFLWTGDAVRRGQPPVGERRKELAALETEVGVVRLGELYAACIPGELYPELVYGKLQEPVDPGADFPDAPREPHVTKLLPSEKLLVVGLANDEIGYIVPGLGDAGDRQFGTG